MTPVINIDVLAVQNLPIDQRKKKWILWAQGLVYPLKWLMGLFVSYQNGTVTGNYSGAVTYSKGDQIIFNYGVWESLVNANTGHTPNTSPLWWVKVNDSFIGLKESSRYGGGRLNREWALNRYFQTTFRQPDSAISPTPSDIYITNDSITNVSFLVGAVEDGSDSAGAVSSSGFIGATETFGTATSYRYTIHFPVAVYNAIGATDAIRESVIRNFADQYNQSGIYYSIATY